MHDQCGRRELGYIEQLRQGLHGDVLGRLGDILEASWGVLEASWGAWGGSWGRFGHVLGALFEASGERKKLNFRGLERKFILDAWRV